MKRARHAREAGADVQEDSAVRAEREGRAFWIGVAHGRKRLDEIGACVAVHVGEANAFVLATRVDERDAGRPTPVRELPARGARRYVRVIRERRDERCSRRRRCRVVAVKRNRREQRAGGVGTRCVAKVIAAHECGADLHVDEVEPARDPRQESGAVALGHVAACGGFEHELHASIFRRIAVQTLERAAGAAVQRVANRREVGGSGIAPVIARDERVAVAIFLLFEQPLEDLARHVRYPSGCRHTEA